MPTNRWPKKVLQWDRVSRTDAWFKEIKHILSSVDMKDENHLSSPVDLHEVANKLHTQARNSWHIEAENKPKLRTFLKIHDFNKLKNIINGNLTRSQRSLVVKLKAGVLPLHLETGRYKGLPEERRICEICNSGRIESEMHHLYDCSNLQYVRNRHPIFKEAKCILDNDINQYDVTKTLLSDNLKETAVWLEDMWRERRRQLYKSTRSEGGQ